MITIRTFTHADIKELWQLKFDTIRSVNLRHYTDEQVKAWAPSEYDEAAWAKRVTQIAPFIAEVDGIIAGFADMQSDGYIDHFFCSHDYQGQGVGTRLMKTILTQAKQAQLISLYSDVSITAKPFFESFGFDVEKAQSIDVRGITLDNFKMRMLLD
ncbi:GNAT family N-acetyltransferase [Shewanella donghaensis]|uniref:GNAT family N-acetyltransferase n=1 Tax=Shewanella donghaensis TaxID=238836 RepID=UPI0011820E52|nr:GNAT family N-acetyltransferase [Shewanella donghaensis]